MIAGQFPNFLAMFLAYQPVSPTSGSLLWVGAIIAALRQKHPIGGWLFFFFWQVASGCALAIASTDWSQYTPSAWTDQFKYIAFMMVTMPRLAILVVIAGLGAALIRTRDWRWVVVLRYTLILYAALAVVCIGADLAYFPDRLRVDTATLIFPVIFTIYFYVSSRVKIVFQKPVVGETSRPTQLNTP